MVPSLFMRLERLPRLPNQKLDRRALPEPALEAERHPVRPANAAEEAIAGIWSALLEVDAADIHQSFFHLGGHSLLAAQAALKMSAVFGVELPLLTFFATPTISELAKAMIDLQKSAVEESELVRMLDEVEAH